MRKAALLLGLVLGLTCLSAQAMDIMSFNRLKYAASSGDVNAMIQVGQLLLDGDGRIGAEPDQAFQYFRKAADRGSPDGMYYTGMCYLYGKGTGLDVNEARGWFQRAADRGSDQARRQLSQMPQQPASNPYGAVMGMGAGAGPAQGGFGSGGGIGTGASSGGGFGSGVSSGGGHHRGGGDREFEEAMSRANQGDAHSMYRVGMMYLNGTNGVPVRPSDAFAWIERSAKTNYGAAERQLSTMYRQGLGTRPNRSEATYWDRQARQRGF